MYFVFERAEINAPPIVMTVSQARPQVSCRERRQLVHDQELLLELISSTVVKVLVSTTPLRSYSYKVRLVLYVHRRRPWTGCCRSQSPPTLRLDESILFPTLVIFHFSALGKLFLGRPFKIKTVLRCVFMSCRLETLTLKENERTGRLYLQTQS